LQRQEQQRREEENRANWVVVGERYRALLAMLVSAGSPGLDHSRRRPLSPTRQGWFRKSEPLPSHWPVGRFQFYYETAGIESGTDLSSSTQETGLTPTGEFLPLQHALPRPSFAGDLREVIVALEQIARAHLVHLPDEP
jgi:hypothetical protein